MRKVLILVALCASIGVLMVELGPNVPTDNQSLTERIQEGGSAGSGIFDIVVAPPGTSLRITARWPEDLSS